MAETICPLLDMTRIAIFVPQFNHIFNTIQFIIEKTSNNIEEKLKSENLETQF